ncbi:DUF1173 family protein [Actinomadura sp. KC216]|nr:DUF1173 family protein [Actinomadura sp. KC216]
MSRCRGGQTPSPPRTPSRAFAPNSNASSAGTWPPNPNRGFSPINGAIPNEQPSEFFKTAESGRSHYSTTAVAEDEEGSRIRLKSALMVRADSGQHEPSAGTHRSAGASPGTVTLLGLLHLLREEASLNRWTPSWGRTWWTCHDRLTSAARDVQVNRRSLTEVLHVAPPYRSETSAANTAALQEFFGRLGLHRTTLRYGLLLREVKGLEASRYGYRLLLRHLPRPVFATAQLIERRGVRAGEVERARADQHQQPALAQLGQQLGHQVIPPEEPLSYANIGGWLAFRAPARPSGHGTSPFSTRGYTTTAACPDATWRRSPRASPNQSRKTPSVRVSSRSPISDNG